MQLLQSAYDALSEGAAFIIIENLVDNVCRQNDA